jgi:hypothetical protein
MGTTIAGTIAIISAETNATIFTNHTGSETDVTIKINSAQGSFVTGSTFDQAVTVLHELGHAMNDLLPNSSSLNRPDEGNTPAGQSQSKANTQTILDKCFDPSI